jgi:hypothetical protein
VSSFGAFILAAALVGCGSTLHDATHPVFLSGDDARTWIDEEAGTMLAARHPGVTIGNARCPYLLNLTGRHTERCTIPIGKDEFRIDVARSETFELRDVDALVVKRDAERELTDDLTLEYGVPFTVRCDGPPVRVVPIRTDFSCAIDAPDIFADRIDVEAIGRDDRLIPHHLKSGDSREARMLGRDVTEKTEGGVTIAGPVVERYLHEITGGILHAELVRRGLLGAAHCPPRLVLSSDSKHATCTVRAGDRSVRYDLRFDKGRGLVIDAQQVAVIPVLRELAKRYYQRLWSTNGKVAAVGVTCGSHDVVVVEPGTTLPCKAWAGDNKAWFVVKIRDAAGNVSFADDD